jgi:hypothetical protein
MNCSVYIIEELLQKIILVRFFSWRPSRLGVKHSSRKDAKGAKDFSCC